MANSRTYLAKLQIAVSHLHKCGCRHVASVPVHETFRGQTVWQGQVEVLDLVGHPKAKRCYAWSHCTGPNDRDENFVAVLELPPVTSAQTAVRAAIVSQFKAKKRVAPSG